MVLSVCDGKKAVRSIETLWRTSRSGWVCDGKKGAKKTLN